MLWYRSVCEAHHVGRGLLLAMSRSSAARELVRYERRWRVCSMVLMASGVRDVMIRSFCYYGEKFFQASNFYGLSVDLIREIRRLWQKLYFLYFTVPTAHKYKSNL